MKIGIAQINTTVGDFAGNRDRILSAYKDAVERGAEIVITPEMSVCGYPPQDLIFRSGFVEGNLKAVDEIGKAVGDVPLVVGCVEHFKNGEGKPFTNSAMLLRKGAEPVRFVKSLLPTYDVFDEARYFQPAAEVATEDVGGVSCGVTICEDIWNQPHLPSKLYVKDPPAALKNQGMEILLNLSASPFHTGKLQERYEMLRGLAERVRTPIVYCNLVAGNDQLVFDGNSLVLDANGKVLRKLAAFEEEVAVVDVKASDAGEDFVVPEKCEEIYGALVLGVRDYMRKCGFKSAALGLSGGIDSALTAAIAADAIGPENVYGVTMPSGYSSSGSVDDSIALGKNLGITVHKVPIEKAFATFKEEMKPVFDGLPEDITEENMQARIRGLIMMSISNKLGHLLLTTGNKSELSVGYCTIYGDMCGGLAAISDVPKTDVYAVSRWINRDREIIPWNTIDKPPSAELAPDQKDEDTLPPYETLDAILELFVERNMSVEEIVAEGHAEETVRWIARRVIFNEWKRHQAAPGIRVTAKAFGLGRRIPIAQKFGG